MSKQRRGWRQASHRAARLLRRARRHARFPFLSARLELKLAIKGDKFFDVHVACGDQLTADRRRPPHAPSGKMDDDYHYGPHTLDGYLTAVRRRLADKGWTFDFDHAFAIAHLSDKLIDLESAIAGKTS